MTQHQWTCHVTRQTHANIPNIIESDNNFYSGSIKYSSPEYSTEQTIHHHHNNSWWFYNWHWMWWPTIPGATFNGASPRSGICCLPMQMGLKCSKCTRRGDFSFLITPNSFELRIILGLEPIWHQDQFRIGTNLGSGLILNWDQSALEPIHDWDWVGTGIESLKLPGYSLSHSSPLNLMNHPSCTLLKACFFSHLTQYV